MKGRKRLQQRDLARAAISARNAVKTLKEMRLQLTTKSPSSTRKRAGRTGKSTTKGCSVKPRTSKRSAKAVTTQKQSAKVPNGKLLNGERITTHAPEACRGSFCCIHNPSDHKMVSWDRAIRFDRNCLMERICPKHRVGHPDPDSAAFLKRIGQYDGGVHGCCGCCREDK